MPIGEVVLAVEGLSNATEYADVSFDLRKGEILGLYGLVGAGRTEADAGAVRHHARRRAATVTLDGEPLSIGAPSDAIAAGISYVPEDRQDQGAILSLGIRENVTLADLAKHVRGLFLSRVVRAGRDAQARPPARGQGGQLGAAARRAFGRQPAEGRHRQMAGDASPR